MIDEKLAKFEIKININFNDKNLLKQVFVHRSYLNENPKFGLEHNERLEFLGDAVLELITTEYLYLKYSNPEGELTNWRSALVKGTMLSKIANDLDINDNLLLSKGESKSSGKSRQLILANALESLIGALYLDRGYKITQKFVYDNLLIHLKDIIENELYRDAKSKLQELSQEQKSITPQYKVIEESGPDHDKVFIVGVYIDDDLIGKGKGSSKQEAEQDAAKNGLINFK